jgi:uncharacterized BrkB/YihY/UPF0761 family membrane protein
MGTILLSSLALNITAGVQNSKVIPNAAKPAITQAMTSQTSGVGLGGPANLDGHLSSAVAGEITSITDQAAVNGNKTAIVYGVIFTLLALFVSTQLPKGNQAEAKSLAHSARREAMSKKRLRAAAWVLAMVIALLVGIKLFTFFGTPEKQKAAKIIINKFIASLYKPYQKAQL